MPSTHCGKQFDPEAQTVCIGNQTTQDADVRTAWYIKFENPYLYNIHGCFACVKYLNEQQVFKVEDGK